MNWMRLTVQSIDLASAFASEVFPTPGTSSTSRCPSASSVTSAVRTTSGLPTSTRSTFAAILRAVSCSSSRLAE